MFTETKKTYFGGGNYAFAGELLPDMTFKGPMPGRTRYVDDQLLFFGIFPELAKSKGGIAIWGNCAEFANLHYPAKRDAISGIESDLDGRIALSVLRQDFEPASDDASLSENFSRIASNFRAGAYDDSANRQREEYVARLRRLGTRFTELPAAIRRSASAYPPGYASKFETHALDAEKFMERYMGEAERIAAKEFDREKPAQLYANLSMQYALREKIVRSVPKVAGKMAKYLATSPD